MVFSRRFWAICRTSGETPWAENSRLEPLRARLCKIVHKHGPFAAEAFHHVLVVDDFVIHVDRRPEQFDRLL